MLTRRDTLAIGLGASAAALLPVTAHADEAAAMEAIAEFTGGAEVAEGGVTLIAPEIAENGNTVPVTIAADGATELALFAAGNPTPKVAKFTFGPAAGASTVSTRIRLGRTQDVIAVAKMADNSYAMTRAEVKVTIGGCGG